VLGHERSVLVLGQSTLLYAFAGTTERLGLVGERRESLVLLFLLKSAHCDKLINEFAPSAEDRGPFGRLWMH
jgi:hypothetical protein